MTLRADQMNRLMALGLAPLQLKAVMEIVCEPASATIRQWGWIAKRPSTVDASTVDTITSTVDAKPSTGDVIVDANQFKERSPTPPKETTTSSLLSKPLSKDSQKDKKMQVARGTRIAVGFQPSQASLEWAQRKFGLDAVAAQEITEEVVDFWKGVPGQRGVKLDWDGTWKNRVREVVGRRKVNGTHQAVQRNGDRKTVHDVNRELLAKVRRGESVALFPGDGDAGGDRFARLLPRLGKG